MVLGRKFFRTYCELEVFLRPKMAAGMNILLSARLRVRCSTMWSLWFEAMANNFISTYMPSESCPLAQEEEGLLAL